jgi:predicted small secreted protein
MKSVLLSIIVLIAATCLVAGCGINMKGLGESS